MTIQLTGTIEPDDLTDEAKADLTDALSTLAVGVGPVVFEPTTLVTRVSREAWSALRRSRR